MSINKNDFCDMPHKDIRALKIPDTVMGFLLSPFHLNERDGYILVPKEAFKEMISLITAHAQAIHDQALDQTSNVNMTKSFEKTRADELETVEKAIEALSEARDLDTLWENERAIRDRLLNIWSTIIGDEEHAEWLDRLNAATQRRQREL
ncbi:hypothetical protein [Pseudomonas viridiflava]